MFIIVMLCNDDGKFYIDYVNKKFDNFQEAQDEMYKCANGELKDLQDIGNYDYVNLGKEFCIYDEDKELVTKYEIINVDN